jgi:hypothetical protein
MINFPFSAERGRCDLNLALGNVAAATTTTLLAAQAAVEPGLPRGDQPLDEHLFSRRSSSIPRVSGASSFTFGLIPSALTRSADFRKQQLQQAADPTIL